MRRLAPAFLLLLAGCNLRIGGSEGLDKVADDLRAQNHSLRDELAAAEAERDELRAKLAALSRDTAEVAEATPRIAGIELDSLSGLSPDGKSFLFYVRPYDGRRRFLQAVGELTLTVEREGSPIAGPLVLSPAQLRDAYRSGFTGTHYSAELPAPAHGLAGELTLRAALNDAATGLTHSATRPITISP